MAKSDEKNVIGQATLVPLTALWEIVIHQLLTGLMVDVEVDGKIRRGRVTLLEIPRGDWGYDNVLANLTIPISDDEDFIEIRVSIQENGKVTIIPESQT